MQMIGELPHRRFFAMDQECHLASLNAAVPCEQFPLIGMSRKSIDGVDGRANGNLFAEEPYTLWPVNAPIDIRASGRSCCL